MNANSFMNNNMFMNNMYNNMMNNNNMMMNNNMMSNSYLMNNNMNNQHMRYRRDAKVSKMMGFQDRFNRFNRPSWWNMYTYCRYMRNCLNNLGWMMNNRGDYYMNRGAYYPYYFSNDGRDFSRESFRHKR